MGRLRGELTTARKIATMDMSEWTPLPAFHPLRTFGLGFSSGGLIAAFVVPRIENFTPWILVLPTGIVIASFLRDYRRERQIID